MQRENRGSRGNARPSGESRETERRRELSSEYDRYRAAYARRAEREEAPDLPVGKSAVPPAGNIPAGVPSARRSTHQPGTAGCRKPFRPERCRRRRTAHPAGRFAPRRERPEHSAAQRRSAAPKDRRSRREQVMRAARLRIAAWPLLCCLQWAAASTASPI